MTEVAAKEKLGTNDRKTAKLQLIKEQNEKEQKEKERKEKEQQKERERKEKEKKEKERRERERERERSSPIVPPPIPSIESLSISDTFLSRPNTRPKKKRAKALPLQEEPSMYILSNCCRVQ